MKKKVLLRSLLGAPLGLAIMYAITLFMSLCVGNGTYYSVQPILIQEYGSEMNAVLLQAFSGILIGAVCAGATVIWEMETWSLLRMTITHLLIISVPMMPVAWFMQWMPHSIFGVLSYIGIFAVIYATIWFSQYFAMKKKIMAMNTRLSK